MGEILIIVLVFVILIYFSKFFLKNSFKNLIISRSPNKVQVFSNEETKITMTIENHMRFPIPFLFIEEQIPKEIKVLKNKQANVIDKSFNYYSSYFSLRGNERIKKIYRVSCKKRGVYYIQNIAISIGDFLAFYHKGEDIEDFFEVVVLPNFIKMGNFKLDNNTVNGENIIRRWIFEDPIYIKGIREYISSDRLKDVD